MNSDNFPGSPYPLHVVDEISRLLASDWQRLGIQLGVPMSELELIRGNTENRVDKWALQLLVTWHKRTEADRWRNLQFAFEKAGRFDLIRLTNEFARQQQVNDLNNLTPAATNQYFQLIAERIPRDWQRIAIYLGFDSYELDSFQSSSIVKSGDVCCWELLMKWMNHHKNRQTLQLDLLNALEKIKRLDVTRYIQEANRNHAARPNNVQPSAPNSWQRHADGPHPPSVQQPSRPDQPPSHAPPSSSNVYAKQGGQSVVQPGTSQFSVNSVSIHDRPPISSIGPSGSMPLPQPTDASVDEATRGVERIDLAGHIVEGIDNNASMPSAQRGGTTRLDPARIPESLHPDPSMPSDTRDPVEPGLDQNDGPVSASVFLTSRATFGNTMSTDMNSSLTGDDLLLPST